MLCRWPRSLTPPTLPRTTLITRGCGSPLPQHSCLSPVLSSCLGPLPAPHPQVALCFPSQYPLLTQFLPSALFLSRSCFSPWCAQVLSSLCLLRGDFLAGPRQPVTRSQQLCLPTQSPEFSFSIYLVEPIGLHGGLFDSIAERPVCFFLDCVPLLYLLLSMLQAPVLTPHTCTPPRTLTCPHALAHT